MADRPHNIRAASILDRSYATGGHNSRRHIPEARGESRGEDNRGGNHSYRGSHRADDGHHTAAENRSSRVGRHHAEPAEEHTRW